MILIKRTIIFSAVLASLCYTCVAYGQSATLKSKKNEIKVVMHRGDWRNAPENSLWAIRKAAEIGADMAEIDLEMTKDSVLILLHDKTLDRTTTGKGKPGDYTLQEIKRFYLRDGLGSPTEMQIPTLAQVLSLAKDKITLNLDKGFDYINMVYPMIKAKGMVDQILFKGSEDYQHTRASLGSILDSIYYMPIIRLNKGEGMERVKEFTENCKPFGFEFTIGETEAHLIDFGALRAKGYHVWINSLWPAHNAHHNDDKALDDIGVYQWFLDQKADYIQTDRPKELLQFLRKHTKHI
ncbi:glycerophosphodiester phosphodiesterase family protein [Pedobacter sp. PAMC26386]|nr:glycerophosphodiester phosphodiesterase family protein [Pedobacter sp. PAMC26386]